MEAGGGDREGGWEDPNPMNPASNLRVVFGGKTCSLQSPLLRQEPSYLGEGLVSGTVREVRGGGGEVVYQVVCV